MLNKDKIMGFGDELTQDQQNEIREATEEIEQGFTTDFETFITKHR